jgi:hypothetical protein
VHACMSALEMCIDHVNVQEIVKDSGQDRIGFVWCVIFWGEVCIRKNEVWECAL